MKPSVRVLSLGAGVQSSTLALMAAHGEIPLPDYALFADTQWEPAHVYTWLDWLEKQLPFPVHRVTAGSIRENLILKASTSDPDVEGRFAAVPFFTSGGGIGRRQCTNEFKLQPMFQEIRRRLGYATRQRIPANAVEMLIGISWDERSRMKPSRQAWMVNAWPLIERRMTRGHCLEWMQSHGYPPLPNHPAWAVHSTPTANGSKSKPSPPTGRKWFSWIAKSGTVAEISASSNLCIGNCSPLTKWLLLIPSR